LIFIQHSVCDQGHLSQGTGKPIFLFK